MEDGVDLLVPGRAQQPAGFDGGQLYRIHTPSLSQVAHLRYNREAAVYSGIDHQSRRLPGDLLVGGKRGVSEPVPIRLGRAFLPARCPPAAIYDHAAVEAHPAMTISPNRRYSTSIQPTLRHRSGCRLRNSSVTGNSKRPLLLGRTWTRLGRSDPRRLLGGRGGTPLVVRRRAGTRQPARQELTQGRPDSHDFNTCRARHDGGGKALPGHSEPHHSARPSLDS